MSWPLAELGLRLSLIVLLAFLSACSPDEDSDLGELLSPTNTDDLRAFRTQRDLDGDGTDEDVVVFLNQDGILVRAEADRMGDGYPDLWARYGIDGTAAIELAFDSDGDGIPDDWRVVTGLRVLSTGRDTSGDGRPDEWSVQDEQSRVISKRADTDGDGQIDTWSSFSENGALVLVEYDTTGDGAADRWVRFAANGSVLLIESDGDGSADQTRTPRS